MLDSDGVALQFMGRGKNPQNDTPKKENLMDLKSRLLKLKSAEKHNELNLFKESESYFRKLVNSAPVALIMTDTSGRCLFANEHWRLMSGLNLQNSIGNGWQKTIHPDDVGKIGSWFYPGEKRHTDPGTECRIFTAEGEIKWVDLRTAPLYDDNGCIIGFIASFSDITHLKENGLGLINKILGLRTAGLI